MVKYSERRLYSGLSGWALNEAVWSSTHTEKVTWKGNRDRGGHKPKDADSDQKQ